MSVSQESLPHAPVSGGPSPLGQSTRGVSVAVIIVTFRTARLTIKSLRSVLGERASPGLSIRAYVIDNASGDLDEVGRAVETEGWSSWVTLIQSPTNGGFAYGNNLGIRTAFSVTAPEYVYLLNPDAEARPGAIGALVRFLDAHPDVGIAGSSFENPDGSDWPIAFRFPSLWSEIDTGLRFGVVTKLLRNWVVAQHMSQTAQPVDWICGASMLIRPSVLTATGGLDEQYFLYFEETDFCFRAKRAGFSTWYVPESRVMHITGQSTDVTAAHATPKRLPGYWFESRRRYFAMTHGIGHAMLVDLVAVAAQSLGSFKEFVLRRRDSSIPHFIRDLISHSIIWPANRNLPPAQGFSPPTKSHRALGN